MKPKVGNLSIGIGQVKPKVGNLIHKILDLHEHVLRARLWATYSGDRLNSAFPGHCEIAVLSVSASSW